MADSRNATDLNLRTAGPLGALRLHWPEFYASNGEEILKPEPGYKTMINMGFLKNGAIEGRPGATTLPASGTIVLLPPFSGQVSFRRNAMRALPLFAAALCLGAALSALPAQADIHQLGAVNVSADQYTHVRWSRFDGPVIRLRFIAANDDIDCEHITVTYHDGTVHEVFSGWLVKDGSETISFPVGDSRIRNVDFACKAKSRDGARIALSSVADDEDWPDMVAPAHVETHEVGRPVN